MNYLVLLIALIVAGVAAYFSVIGIGLIFAGSFWAAVVMGVSLEGAKIVGVSWLYRHWNLAHILLKAYLIGAIVVLSLITSLGIFGFLSRAHIEQQNIMNTGAASQVELINDQITQQKIVIGDIDKRIGLIDNALQKMIDTNRARGSLSAGDDQRRARATLNNERTKANQELNNLTMQRIKLQNQVRTAEVEVGPIRYFAEFFFDKSDNSTLERAVRWLIIVIIFVFDPLSIALFVAYNTTVVKTKPKEDEGITLDFRSEPKPKQVLTAVGNSDMIQVHKSHIKEM